MPLNRVKPMSADTALETADLETADLETADLETADLETAIDCAIGLGSNLGDRLGTLQGALAALDQIPGITVMQCSPWYETAPIGPPQPDYLNCCAWLQTALLPHNLLQCLLAVEQRFGRQRRERWGPRSLDLDLLLYGNQILDSPDLTLPHPYLAERAFVLVPLAQIAGHWLDPRSGQTIAELLQWVDCSGVNQYQMPAVKPLATGLDPAPLQLQKSCPNV
jgi:2-amino-4-hydroxy-6-hydroxymethyldihydropteridine diphosphokinase